MEKVHNINGVQGRYWKIKKPGVRAAGCHDAQKWISESRHIPAYGGGALMRVEIRHDDQCKNGHNSFTVTGDVTDGKGSSIAGGCLHDDITVTFPELAHLIRWHLCDVDGGPLHYVANASYFAGDADACGRRAGEPSAFSEAVRFVGVPIATPLKKSFWQFLQDNRAATWGQPEFDFEVIRYDHDGNTKPGSYQLRPKFTFGGYAEKWHECPFDTEAEALDFLKALQTCNPEFIRIPTAFSEGKARELEAARRAAVWPEATDAELSVPRAELEAALRARLPGLLAAMRADIEAAGFEFTAPAEGGAA